MYTYKNSFIREYVVYQRKLTVKQSNSFGVSPRTVSTVSNTAPGEGFGTMVYVCRVCVCVLAAYVANRWPFPFLSLKKVDFWGTRGAECFFF